MPLNEQRAVANVRERKRTQKLNQAYKQLQAIIPKEPSDKMSKIHTLRLALSYIDFLNNILKQSDQQDNAVHSTVGELGSPKEQPRPSGSPYVAHPQVVSPAGYATSGSPSGSSSGYVRVSAPSSEDEHDDQDHEHRSKRAKFDHNSNNIPQYQANLTTIPPTNTMSSSCYNNHNFSAYYKNHENPRPTYYANTNNNNNITSNIGHNLTLNNLLDSNYSTASSYYASPSSCSGISCKSSIMATTTAIRHPETTMSLKSAFREYRSLKRKSFSE